ncbi:MAG TPA: division/cell wall cluster transcriptional repressor MraZ [Steroidobacteraceae bacterium]|nr:division/cell wall cluster transcriptional repressor MraZ [Steroidobacteraceae bacterium]
MFRGPNSVTLDAKGRMLLPARVREQLAAHGEGLVVTVDRDPCVLLYPLGVWQSLQDTLMRLPNMNPDTRRLQRLMVGYATDIAVDAQGRILLPPEHRKYAALQHDVMLVGQGNHFELWDEARWDQDVARAQPAQQEVPASGLDQLTLSGAPGAQQKQE